MGWVTDSFGLEAEFETRAIRPAGDTFGGWPIARDRTGGRDLASAFVAAQECGTDSCAESIDRLTDSRGPTVKAEGGRDVDQA